MPQTTWQWGQRSPGTTSPGTVCLQRPQTLNFNRIVPLNSQAIASQTGAQNFTFDDAATLGAAGGDPAGFIRGLPGPAVIDEVQKAPDLFPAIKLAVDRDRRPGHFLLTGSANVMTLPRLSESLAGRMEIVPLFPFSAGELSGRREGFLQLLFEGALSKVKIPTVREDIPGRLARGEFPEAMERKKRVNPDIAKKETTAVPHG